MKIKDLEQAKENVHSISNSETVMDHFMKRLENDDFTRDKEPTIGKELTLDEKFIDAKIESYTRLLQSPIMQEIEEPRLVKTNVKK